MNATERKIRGFDGVRGLCVFAVFLSHKCDLKFNAANIGVWTFLVLSGFLIIRELHRASLDIENGTISYREAAIVFLFKRATRVFPAYYALLSLLAIGSVFISFQESGAGFLWHAAYLSNFYVAYFSPYSGSPFGVLWTLSVEQQYYLCAPFVLLATAAGRHVFVLIFAILCALLGQIVMISQGVPGGAIYLTGPWNYALISIGGLAGIILLKNRNTTALSSNKIVFLAVIIICAYSISNYSSADDEPWVIVIMFCSGPAIACIIVTIYLNQDGFLVKVLEWYPLRELGVISYGFYLIHNFIPSRSLGIPFVYIVGGETSKLFGAFVSFVISYLIALLSWNYLERPIIKLRANWLAIRLS